MIVAIASADRLSRNMSSDGNEYWGGSGWVRIGQYLEHLPFKIVVGYVIWKRTHFVLMDDNEVEHTPDVIVMQRLMHDGLADHIKAGREAGQIIINDIDDWYWGLRPSNNAWKHAHPKTNKKENVNHYRSIIASSSLITVSTPYLASRIAQFVNAPMLIMENTVDIQRFSIHEQEDTDKPLIGWAGSTAHRSGDLETVANILKMFYRNDEFRFMHLGNSEGHAPFADYIGIPREAVSTVDLLPPNLYPLGFVMDIGIVPLSDTPFNHAKSDIKGLEYAAAGIPFVAQDLSAYKHLKSTTGVGRIAKRPADWIKHLRALKDPLLRREEGLENRERLEPRDLKHGAARWVDLLSNIRQ